MANAQEHLRFIEEQSNKLKEHHKTANDHISFLNSVKDTIDKKTIERDLMAEGKQDTGEIDKELAGLEETYTRFERKVADFQKLIRATTMDVAAYQKAVLEKQRQSREVEKERQEAEDMRIALEEEKKTEGMEPPEKEEEDIPKEEIDDFDAKMAEIEKHLDPAIEEELKNLEGE